MKHSIHFILLLLFSSFWANAQKITFSENPVAYKYLLKHYGFKGKVKSVTSYGSNNYLMIDELFDKEGRRTNLVSYSGMPTTTNYTYDKSNNTIKQTQQTGKLPPIINLYKYNSNQEVEFSLYKEDDTLRKFDYRENLLIKDSSANKYSTQKAYYSYYEYNGKGQLTKLWDFNGGGKLGREEIYSYEGNVVTVKGKSYPSFAGGTVSEYEKKKYYDKKGSLIKDLYSENNKTETTEYKLDANGNWIWKTGEMTRKIAYYE